MTDDAQVLDPQVLELSLTAQFAAWAMLDEVSDRLTAEGFGDTRSADGVVVQHLVDGPRSITDLAARMGVTQQAASKSVADLEARGYVARRIDPEDRRGILHGQAAYGFPINEFLDRGERSGDGAIGIMK